MKYLIFLFLVIIKSCSFTGVTNTSEKTSKVNLDLDPEILDWYIDGNDTIIYTVKDSIKDEIERRKYKDSLYNLK